MEVHKEDVTDKILYTKVGGGGERKTNMHFQGLQADMFIFR